MSDTPWYQDPITVAHGVNGEQGIDLGTPFHTLITALFGGTVKSASYGPWGGLVDIEAQVPGYAQPLSEYILHLDQIDSAIQPGAQVAPGQLLGLSGGQLQGGLHPVQRLYSNGPHTEAGFFVGDPFASASIDPTTLVQSGGDANLLSYAPGVPSLRGRGDPGTPNGPAVSADPFGIQQLGSDIAGIPTTIGHGLADAFAVAEADLGVWLKRQSVAFFVAALVLLVLFA